MTQDDMSSYPAGLRYSGRAVARADGKTTISTRLGDASKLPASALRYAVVYRMAMMGMPRNLPHGGAKIAYQQAVQSMTEDMVERLADRYAKKLGGEAGMRAWLQAQMDAESEMREAEYRNRHARRARANDKTDRELGVVGA